MTSLTLENRRKNYYNDVHDELPPISETGTTAFFLLKEQKRVQRLFHFLRDLVVNQETERQTAINAWAAWKTLEDVFSHKLSVPDANVGADGQILYTWDNNEHHFELEVYPDNTGELFYLNFRNNDTWDGDYSIGDDLPEEATRKLKLFFGYE